MGFNLPQWKFLNKCFNELKLFKNIRKFPKYKILLKDEPYYNMNMLELGCQEIREKVRNNLLFQGISSKKYFISIGIDHTSFDIKSCHGAIKTDLRKPVDENFYNKFDIITNSGTTEHVKPLKYQYECFKNIHLCAKKGAVMIHILPGFGKYFGHCQTYYDYEFYKTLSKLNNYKMILIEDVKKRSKFVWIGVCLIKIEDNDFTNNKEDFFKYIKFVEKKIFLKHQNNKNKYML